MLDGVPDADMDGGALWRDAGVKVDESRQPLDGWDQVLRGYDGAIALAAESLTVLRRTDDRRLILRGLVFLANAYADAKDVESAEAILTEAEELADGDPIWELAAIRGDCEHYKGNDAAALSWWAESLTWTSTNGEWRPLRTAVGHAVDDDERVIAKRGEAVVTCADGSGWGRLHGQSRWRTVHAADRLDFQLVSRRL